VHRLDFLYTLAILEGVDKYETLRDGAVQLQQELQELQQQELRIKDRLIAIVLHWCSDLKFTWIAFGIGPRGECNCLYCCCSRGERLLASFILADRFADGKPVLVRPSLFPFISPFRIIFDCLHCLLRVFDVLFIGFWRQLHARGTQVQPLLLEQLNIPSEAVALL